MRVLLNILLILALAISLNACLSKAYDNPEYGKPKTEDTPAGDKTAVEKKDGDEAAGSEDRTGTVTTTPLTVVCAVYFDKQKYDEPIVLETNGELEKTVTVRNYGETADFLAVSARITASEDDLINTQKLEAKIGATNSYSQTKLDKNTVLLVSDVENKTDMLCSIEQEQEVEK